MIPAWLFEIMCCLLLLTIGVSWGRIAALIAFSGRLALHCATHDMVDMVPSVIGWTARYLDGNLHGWMGEHNNWVSVKEVVK